MEQALTSEETRLLDVGVEMGLLTADQVRAAHERRKQLARGGINLLIGQTLIERRFLTPSQLKLITDEIEARKKALNKGPSKAAMPAVGPNKTFGNFELILRLSEKGHSRVFKARDTVMNRTVVLKILTKGSASDKIWADRFKREMQLAGKLTHPNIVTTYGGGEHDGNMYMAFEFIEGRSLEDRLEREGNFSERTAWLMVREVAKGLAYAAANGVLHRDIKPENILCSNDGHVKIIDMGFSKSLADDTALTQAGTTVGTPFYISPEQARGTRDLDARTDLYSLGCTAYHMLTGSVPFLGEQVTDIMLKHTQAPRPDPREILPEISEASAKLVMRMMAISPNDRPGSAAELVTEIDALIEALPQERELIRPVQKVAPSNTGGVLKDNSPQKADDGEKYARKPGFVAWLKRLFGG